MAIIIALQGNVCQVQKKKRANWLTCCPFFQWLDTHITYEVIPLNKSSHTTFLMYFCP